jgi:hypothetical protein
MTDDTHWLDPGTNLQFVFNRDDKFVDSDGNGPQKGFKNGKSFCDWLHLYIERQLQELGMLKLLVPGVPKGAPVYYTPNALNSPDNLLVLITGSGRIHVGVWSVGVCAYHGLFAGSVLPFIHEAAKRNMEVIVLNPNHRGSKLLPKKFCHDGMINHTVFVFDHYIIHNNDPRRVFIVAHSMGGECTSTVIEAFPEWAMQKIAAIAMTDGFPNWLEDPEQRQWTLEHCINWVKGEEEVNTQLEDGPVFRARSAGTMDHPLTTSKAFPYIWEFFDSVAD